MHARSGCVSSHVVWWCTCTHSNLSRVARSSLIHPVSGYEKTIWGDDLGGGVRQRTALYNVGELYRVGSLVLAEVQLQQALDHQRLHSSCVLWHARMKQHLTLQCLVCKDLLSMIAASHSGDNIVIKHCYLVYHPVLV